MKKHAFTLIELLVVIAIIAILAAILFPVLTQAKASAKKVQCLSQAREVGLALMLYMSGYDDRYPQEHPSTGNPAVDDDLAQLEGIDYGSPFDKILPYAAGPGAASDALYICPSDPDPRGHSILDAAGNCVDSSPLAPPPGPLNSFLLNAYFLFGATSTEIDSPAQTIYISERKDQFCDVHYHPWLGETELPTSAADATNPIAIASRHFGQGNYVYADGHAKTRVFSATRGPFPGHELYGEHQAF